jgi:two-component system phosphate regulon response regulator PhoB
MPKERILIVEDDADIAELMRYNLTADGYRVDTTKSGEDGLRSARKNSPDLVLLDIMLPDIDGLEVCRLLKKDTRTEKIPIVMVTARHDDIDVVAGLELGADDYIPKPFSPRVLLARVRAVLRRVSAQPAGDDSPLVFDDLAIDPGRHEVTVKGKQVDMTSTEFALLHFLAGHPGRVYSRQQIVDAIHGDNYPVTDRSVDVQVAGLRKKLGPEGSRIETVRGIGYKLRD